MRRAIGFSLLMLSACVAPNRPAPPPEPVPTPPRTPAPAPPPVPQGDAWRDAPLTPGDWSYRRAGTHTEAAYGEAGMKPVLVMRCDHAAQRVRLIWATAAAGPLTIRTTDAATPRAAGRSEAGLEVDFATRDPLLDQMAFSRGRFMLVAGGQWAIVPAWPEVSRVIEDCR
ncbi:hypothetical protein GON01_07075 [Sphingomonas sp. MAH-20]|jgi:hypothetical protein|uniref:Lipoprotein n=1 Tax=Sphingomonas horti TaxID=2682842 RepID=A0A6I4IZU4_9SPHN|nr:MULTISPECIES: hypothetical protein [Sphingomonas]MBA2920761.1 hypothetical protein [Sphingomonas sp. CGMCC 1.13658]MVO77697.1 hypothetical protein [Sphingomonas horti]